MSASTPHAKITFDPVTNAPLVDGVAFVLSADLEKSEDERWRLMGVLSRTTTEPLVIPGLKSTLAGLQKTDHYQRNEVDVEYSVVLDATKKLADSRSRLRVSDIRNSQLTRKFERASRIIAARSSSTCERLGARAARPSRARTAQWWIWTSDLDVPLHHPATRACSGMAAMRAV